MSLPEPFSDGNSLLHRLDPRGRMVVAGAFAILLATTQSHLTALGGLCLALMAVTLGRLPLKKVLTRLAAVNIFILFLWLVLPFSYPGAPVGRVGPLVATSQGLSLAGLITLKTNAIILALIALVATVPVITLGQALLELKCPAKLAHLLLFSYRYIHVFAQEYHRLIQAMKVRGFRPRTDLHTYRSYAYLAAMLLVRSYDRAERVYQAMLCRGFQGNFYSLKSFSWQRRDSLFVTISVFSLLVLGIWERIRFPFG